MKRVMIVGQPGGGKSWLARAMGRITGLPVYHMDLIHWKPGWVERPMAEKLDMAAQVESSSEWIFEGGLSRTFENRLARCDTLIVLDMPFVLRIWRVFFRTIRQHGKTRPDLPQNCPERFDAEFWHFIWRTRRTARARIRRLAHQAGPDIEVHVLKSRADVSRFLAALERRTHGRDYD